MSEWAAGYVVDVGYTHGFYRELTPTSVCLAALLQGFLPPDLERAGLRYCELGCGQGYSINLHASVNPGIEFYATDFNPAHIAGARGLASAAGLSNVRFFEQSFAEFLDNPEVPSFDFIMLHGIYSWISPENRKVLVRFIREKLNPGGIAYISYNAMPGWASLLPFHHLISEYAAARGTGPTLKRIKDAIAFLERLEASKAKYFGLNPKAGAHLKLVQTQNPSYLAHEYINRDFKAFHFAEVARDMAEAKLTFVASAHLVENLDSLQLLPEQAELIGEAEDVVLRHTLRDHIVDQSFRRDIFIKGPTALTRPAAEERWLNQRFALTSMDPDAPRRVRTALGDVELQAALYDPLAAALGSGPKTVQELLSVPDLTKVGSFHLRQSLIILASLGGCHPCLPQTGEDDRCARARRFNAVVAERAKDNDDLAYLASGVTGGGIRTDSIARLIWLARQREAADVPQFVWQALKRSGRRITRAGSTLETVEDNLEGIGESVAMFDRSVEPVLVNLGIS